MTPKFPNDISIPVRNHLTGSTYFLRRADEVEATDTMLERLIAISNEPKVYSWIFQERLKGQAYGMAMAKGFFKMGSDGWNNHEQFVFMLLTEDGHPAANIDIKTADINGAEIGYLSSNKHSGVMTNTVLAVAAIAREAGYTMLWARSLKDNIDSSRVLVRAGFTFNEKRSTECETYHYYELELPD
ncbi:MAG: GNAT family N-acetyltransferase [Akkermansiaceae bacterium]